MWLLEHQVIDEAPVEEGSDLPNVSSLVIEGGSLTFKKRLKLSDLFYPDLIKEWVLSFKAFLKAAFKVSFQVCV